MKKGGPTWQKSFLCHSVEKSPKMSHSYKKIYYGSKTQWCGMTLKMKGLKLNQNQLQRIFKKCQDLRSKIMILFWYYFNHSVKRFRCKRVPINAHFSYLKLFARKKVQKKTFEKTQQNKGQTTKVQELKNVSLPICSRVRFSVSAS